MVKKYLKASLVVFSIIFASCPDAGAAIRGRFD
jgi:hypothetical protein